jgi:tryptophan 2,3-dioxygenase
MKEDQIRIALRQFSVREYIGFSRSQGRASLDQELRHQAAMLYEQIHWFRQKEPFISKQLATTLDLADRVLFSEWFLLHHPEPRYPAYTNIHVLNWVLGTTRRAAWSTVRARCWMAIQVLLQDLLSFEVCSLAQVEPWQQQNCDLHIVDRRVHLLQKLHGQLANMHFQSPIYIQMATPPDDWFSYALDESRTFALLYLTALPQTQEHDEFLFLRTIHISECIYWAVLAGVVAAIESAKREQFDAAATHLSHAATFAKVLVPLFQMFKTMPPEHFAKFRDATGNASAIQSRTYQLMQIFTAGLDERNAENFAATPEIADLVFYGHPRFVDLRTAFHTVEGNTSPGGMAFTAQVAALDQALYAWRCLHLGIARHYLPAATTGTGGTRGTPYLEMTYRRKILSNNYRGTFWPDIRPTLHTHARPVLSPMN